MSYVVFVETSVFTRQIVALLSDEAYRRFQVHLVGDPRAGDVIPGSGGLRKVRWGSKGKGKRGGIRVIYYYLDVRGRLYLLFAYLKGRQGDLTRMELRELRRVMAEE